MFATASKTIVIFISMMALLSIYPSKVDAANCFDTLAASELARVNAEAACDKAAQIAWNSADATKAVAKKACDDAKYIAKNIADANAAAACY